jgi:hypothetical protein
MRRFMSTPSGSRHFADQHFLRRYVWPYARTSLMQHDSIFGFRDAVPFPDGTKPDVFHVGCFEKVVFFSAKVNFPNGSEVVCKLYLLNQHNDGQTCDELIYLHKYAVHDGAVKVHIPERYARLLQQGTARIYLTGGGTPLPLVS